MAKTSLTVDTDDLASRITRTPFPGSAKIYIEGSRPDIRVPFREVTLTDTLVSEGAETRREANPPLRLFDVSGVYTDPDVAIDVTRGLQPLRGAWINERQDTEALDGISSAYGRERLNDPALDALRMAKAPVPRRAKPGMNVSQMHYARKGIITPEMEYIAIRENLVRAQARRIVDAGVVQSYFLSSYSARKLGMKTTGHAGGSQNLCMTSRRTKPGDTLDKMLAKLGRGLFVTELMGQGVNYVTGDYSRGAAGFWVEDGRIVHPVHEVTIAGHLRQMFKDIVAVGADTYTQGSKTVGSVLVSRMKLAGS